MTPEALLVTGTVGVGKTSVAEDPGVDSARSVIRGDPDAESQRVADVTQPAP